MTAVRLLAIIGIYLCTMIGWFILGSSISFRTDEKMNILGERITHNWGDRHIQQNPQFYYLEDVPETITERVLGADGRATEIKRTVMKTERRYLESEKTSIAGDLSVDFRQKGLLWYSVYQVDFQGHYLIKNPTGRSFVIFSEFSFPAKHAIYDAFVFTADGVPLEQQQLAGESDRLSGKLTLAPGVSTDIRLGYRSQGTESWSYSFGDQTKRIKNFELTLITHFDEFDIPDGAISPGKKEKTSDGWSMTWKYDDVISNIQVAVGMPHKLNPGPIGQRISFFAPVSLLFFFTIMIIMTALKKRMIHPMNYFFLAAAFFAFHLLFAYLVDHLSLEWSFVISSAVSVFLVFTYLRLVIDQHFTLRIALPAQLIYLVLFSFSFFFEGYTGLTVTIGSVITLFVLMQITGRIDWNHVFQQESTNKKAVSQT